MDAVTDIFQNVQIADVIQARLEATAPWALKRELNAKNGDGGHSTA
jgi:hypothetical protein